uniref:Polysaccharide deacetylase n=1 Tax=Rhodopseudomonas palustris (strain BisA53) TaxID=316055 RepID=Q07MQ0_RHOP5
MTAIGNWRRLRLQAGYFSGLAALAGLRAADRGLILKIDRVRPRRSEAFQPLKARELTPEQLERAISSLRRWKVEFLSIDQLCARLAAPRRSGRFVCLSFDGGSRDLLRFGAPVLARQGVPYTMYLPTAFPDGLGTPWWLALEQVIARHDRLALMIDGVERRFDCASLDDKYHVYHFLSNWMQSLAAADLSPALADLCQRYSVDLQALAREASMGWDEVIPLAADPLVTIGSATVNFAELARLDDASAQREIRMGRAVAEAALGRGVPHLAFPFGTSGSFDGRHVRMAEQAGFASAVTALPGAVTAKSNRLALPRVTFDGSRRSLRMLKAMLSGL